MNRYKLYKIASIILSTLCIVIACINDSVFSLRVSAICGWFCVLVNEITKK